MEPNNEDNSEYHPPIPQTPKLVPYNPNNILEETKSLLDSNSVRWLQWIIGIVVIPVFLWGGGHIWVGVEDHSKLLAGIQQQLKDIKEAQDDLKTVLTTIAQTQSKDEQDIAALQQVNIDRPPITPSLPPIPQSPRQPRSIRHRNNNSNILDDLANTLLHGHQGHH